MAVQYVSHVHRLQATTTEAPPMPTAAPFLDNAPSWQELQSLVEAKQKQLNAIPPDLETASPLSFLGWPVWPSAGHQGSSAAPDSL
jgi:hypothetical protein